MEGGSVFALRECFRAVARAEEWQMGGDERLGERDESVFLTLFKIAC